MPSTPLVPEVPLEPLEPDVRDEPLVPLTPLVPIVPEDPELPLAILTESSVMAERGISNKPLPLPLYIEAVKVPSIFVAPINLISAGITIASTRLNTPAIDECNWQL